MSILRFAIVIFFLGMFAPVVSQAHFQLLIPSRAIVQTASDDHSITLNAVFTHPMAQGPVMEMGQPHKFGVYVDGSRQNLLNQLEPIKRNGQTTYRGSYTLSQPGDHIFYIEPKAYWEPAEQKMIKHYTKVIVNAFGAETGWDSTVGFPVEIKPLVRPYGLWCGNTFRGIVRKNGKPVPFATIEVEYWNHDGDLEVPSSPFETQVIKADKDGVFSYTMPVSGWWGFAALMEADKKMENPDGKPVKVEQGALIWVRTTSTDVEPDFNPMPK